MVKTVGNFQHQPDTGLMSRRSEVSTGEWEYLIGIEIWVMAVPSFPTPT